MNAHTYAALNALGTVGRWAWDAWTILVSLVTGGRVDYLSDARRPWVVQRGRWGRISRGRTLLGALVHAFLDRHVWWE